MAARRGQRGVAPVAVPPIPRPSGNDDGLLDLSILDQNLPTAASSTSPPLPQRAQLVSPQMFALPNATIPLTSTPLSGSQSLQSLSNYTSPPAPPGMLSFPPPPVASSSSRSTRPPPFSYKRHFKTAYLTHEGWLNGPGRLLSTQMSADDGVVTSLGFDDEWIVVGMATSKVHVFEGGCGTYVRTLEGHELGVWCLTLVSKGGGPRGGTAAADVFEDDDEWDGVGKGKGRGGGAAFERPFASPMGTTFPQPGSSSLTPPTQNFFRDGATTPLAASFHSSPSSPSGGPHPPPLSHSTRPQTRRRRSFPSSSTPPAPTPSPPSGTTNGSEKEEGKGGMGIGAGGTTGDASQQAGVCGTARGYGQKGALVVSGGCDRDVRVWDVETG